MDLDELIDYMTFAALGIAGGTALVICLIVAIWVIASVTQWLFVITI